MAAGTYTVNTEPQEGRSYPNKNGPKDAEGNPTTKLTVWRLGLEGAESDAEDNLFELHKKEGGKPPGVGDTIEVERFFPIDFNGVKDTRIKQVYGGGGGGSSGGGGHQGDGPGLTWQSKPYERGAEHPRNEARVIHTAALSATPGFIEQMLTIGVADQPQTWDDYWKLVGKVATKLSRSYDQVVDGASGVQQQLPVAGGEVPADTDGLEPQPQVADDKIPF